MNDDAVPPSGQDGSGDGMAEIDILLRELLVGPRRVQVDPATGRVVAEDAPEKSTLDRSAGRE
jgi:hypothetical protein